MFRIWLKSLLAIAGGLAVASAAQASTISVADTQDTFVYGFLSTSTGASLSGFFPGTLGIANDSPHSANSFIEFGGLAGSGVTASQVSSATLTFTVGTGAGFGPGPSAGSPVIIDLYAAGAAWDPSTITWNNQPGAASPGLIGQVTDNGPLSTVTFNVTSLVESWLNGALVNNGFILTQDNAGGQSMTFNSMTASSGQPELTITTFATPEPGSLLLACLAAGTIGLWGIRRSLCSVRGE